MYLFFYAKTQNHVVSNLCDEKFTIASRKDFIIGNRKQVVICPLYAMKHFLSRTDSIILTALTSSSRVSAHE